MFGRLPREEKPFFEILFHDCDNGFIVTFL